MGGLVVGSGDIASFVAESEVGAPIVPVLGGFVKHRLDRTRFGPRLGSLRDDLLAFFPFLNDPYQAPLDLVTGRRLHTWSGPARLVDGQIQRGGAQAYPIAPYAQLTAQDLFGNTPGPASNAGSVSCWIKVHVDDSNLVPVVLIGPAVTESVFMGFFSGSFAVGAQSSTLGVLDLCVTTPKTMALWHHVVWSADDSIGDWRVWVDGVEQVLTPLIGSNDGYWSGILAFLGFDLDLVVGRQADFATNCGFSIHELGIWNRVLTQAEINQLYLQPDSIYAYTRRAIDLDPTRHTNVRSCSLHHIFEMQCALARVGATPRMQALSHVFEMQCALPHVGAAPRTQALSHIFEMQAAAAVMGAAPVAQALSHIFEMQHAAAVMGAAPTLQTLSHIFEMQAAAAVMGATPTAQALSHIFEMQAAAAVMGAAPTAQTISHVYEMQHATAATSDVPVTNVLRHTYVMRSARVLIGTSVPACKIEHIYTIPTVAAVMGAAPTAQALSHIYEMQHATVIEGGAPRTATLSHVYATQPATVALGTVVLVCSLHLRHVLWPVEIDTPVAPVLVTQITATLLDNTITASIEPAALVASLAPDAVTASLVPDTITASLTPDVVTATVVDDTLNATLDCG